MSVAAAALLLAAASAPVDYPGDARALDRLIVDNYAYLDPLPGGVLPDTPELRVARDAVHDRASLLRYAEDRLATLADHHAMTGSSFPDDWAIAPTSADLWIVRRDGTYLVDAVREGSPAARAGVVAGDRLAAVAGVPTGAAVAAFWRAWGLEPVGERADYAARVLAAGRRDRPRVLTFERDGVARAFTLAHVVNPALPPLTVTPGHDATVIRFNNSLGDQATVAAFDAAMATLPARQRVVIDLTTTPSGGNTSVARGVMGWFVTRPSGYQVHRFPAEERETGIARQWIEQVLPRAGRYHPGRVDVRVGRWTGSMGEGLAIGLHAVAHAQVCGGPMAGLKGAVYDFTLPSSGLLVKFPAERLFTIDGVPREAFRPARVCR